MSIATITAEGRGATDQLLSAVAARLVSEGHRPVGVVKTITGRPLADHCDMDLQVLPDGPVIRITQNLGAYSASCRLDAGALEDAVGAVGAALDRPADLLILNKFGLREAEGHGFRGPIAEALGRGLPVLIGLSETHRPAFEAFAGGLAIALPPELDAVLAWCRAAVVSKSV